MPTGQQQQEPRQQAERTEVVDAQQHLQSCLCQLRLLHIVRCHMHLTDTQSNPCFLQIGR